MAGYIGSKASVTQVDGYNRTEADNEFVQVTGDTMTGNLSVTGTVKSTVSTTGDNNFQAISTGGGQYRIYPDDATTANPTWLHQSNSSEEQAWVIGGVERMRIAASGDVLVGKTSLEFTSEGIALRERGETYITSDGRAPLLVNRLTSDGDIVSLRKNGIARGSIGINTSRPFFAQSGNMGIACSGSSLLPTNGSGAANDNTNDIGFSSFRWDDIYATNGTIQTSDRNEKQDIEALSDAEQRVAVACKGLLRKFRWKDAVAEKGDDARIHFGIIAQDLQDAFTAEGLDAGRYAMFISSTWWETQTEVPAVEAVAEVLDDDGNVVTEAVEAKDAYTRTDTYETLEEAPEGATERTRLGVRYPELLAFIIGAM